MNRKKGFTLVELLAVIAILAIILTILAPSLLNGIKSKKEDALNKIYDLIETAARSYVMDYDIDTPTIIQMEDLCETTYIECPVLNPETEEELNGYVFVGNDYYYGEQESIKLTVDLNGATPNQVFNETYAPGTVIELQDVLKESYTYIGWDVVEGNSLIYNNKLIIGTSSTIIKPKLIRFLNNYIKYLYDYEETRTLNGLVVDDTVDQNKRYAGSTENVKNKVYFNCASTDGTNAYGSENYNYESSCEIWRIIGVFKTYEDENDTEGDLRIKIVRDEVLSTEMPWDTTADGVEYINQWGKTTLISNSTTPYAGSSLMQYLNGETEGDYYYGLSSIAKEQIDDALWYTGAILEETASGVYVSERGNTTGTATTVNYTTKWVGKIGLIYASDFGYAGTNCGSYTIVNYDNANSCGKTNNWLKSSSTYWTISPRASSDASAWRIVSSGFASSNIANNTHAVRPTLYLSSSVQIIGGDGNEIPYKLSVDSRY